MRSPRVLERQLGWCRFGGFQITFLLSLCQFVLAPFLWSFWIILFGITHPVELVLGPHGADIVIGFSSPLWLWILSSACLPLAEPITAACGDIRPRCGCLSTSRRLRRLKLCMKASRNRFFWIKPAIGTHSRNLYPNVLICWMNPILAG